MSPSDFALIGGPIDSGRCLKARYSNKVDIGGTITTLRRIEINGDGGWATNARRQTCQVRLSYIDSAMSDKEGVRVMRPLRARRGVSASGTTLVFIDCAPQCLLDTPSGWYLVHIWSSWC